MPIRRALSRNHRLNLEHLIRTCHEINDNELTVIVFLKGEMFDPKEMKRLYDLGYSIATSDNPWQKDIPLFREELEWI